MKFQKLTFPSWYSSQQMKWEGEIRKMKHSTRKLLLPFSLVVQTENSCRMEDL